MVNSIHDSIVLTYCQGIGYICCSIRRCTEQTSLGSCSVDKTVTFLLSIHFTVERHPLVCNKNSPLAIFEFFHIRKIFRFAINVPTESSCRLYSVCISNCLTVVRKLSKAMVLHGYSDFLRNITSMITLSPSRRLTALVGTVS